VALVLYPALRDRPAHTERTRSNELIWIEPPRIPIRIQNGLVDPQARILEICIVGQRARAIPNEYAENIIANEFLLVERVLIVMSRSMSTYPGSCVLALKSIFRLSGEVLRNCVMFQAVRGDLLG